ncbi:MAG: hypothetical protein N2C14_20650, partial [Planctomycetales bacterium]
MKTWTAAVAFPLLAVAAMGQGSTRQVSAPGEFAKYLTPDQIDSWILEGKQGETIIAHVATREFDPVLQLTRPRINEDDEVLLKVDDEGSESRLAIRLPAAGKYRIRVHGYKFKGGGNYTLRLMRFVAAPLTVGTSLVGTFDRQGRAHHYFPATKDAFLVPDLQGVSSGGWELLGIQGEAIDTWSGAARIDRTGEHSLTVSGTPRARYRLLVRKANARVLADNKKQAEQLQPGEMAIWNLQAKPGEFRLLEV